MRRFQEKVLRYYAKNKRDLPWRKTRDPYAILVSEIMLQQTQVDRVIPYFLRWMERFPTAAALARARKRTVLAHWSGLGYNSRCLRLQQCASVVAREGFPKTYDALLKLPGIGPYTAGAVLAFAFNKVAPVVDTNIRRVLIHEIKLREDISDEELKRIALKTIPRGKSRIWHNALMDYGAMHATARKTGVTSLSKQSTFEGSERQVRGQIVKLLLKEKKVSLLKLQRLYEHPKFASIVEKMKIHGLVKQEGHSLKL